MNGSPPVTLPAMPAGWAPSQVTPEIIQRATAILNNKSYAYGQGEVQEVGGRVLAFRVEPHLEYASGAPSEWHRGVTAWERIDKDAPIPSGMTSKLPDAFDKASKKAFPWVLLLLGGAAFYFIKTDGR